MIERDLLHVRRYNDGPEDGWLALDLVSGERVYELCDAELPPEELPAPLLISCGDSTCAQFSDGGLLISQGAFWSLLDPLNPRPFTDSSAADRQVAEKDLRDLVPRFQERVGWWQQLDDSEREGCRRLLKGRKPDLSPLLDILDQLPLSPREIATEDEPIPYPAMEPDLPRTAQEMLGFFQGTEGLGSIYGDHFRPREEQAIMAQEVALALEDKAALMIEAGTGVGKTLAYLVPLISAIDDGDSRAVISTHTKALQSQILEQDLPRLKPLLQDRSFNLLMGRANYLCLRQRLAFFAQPVDNFEQALAAAAFRLWLQETKEGLREELADHPLLGPDLNQIFFRSDMCLPGQCYEGGKCFVQKARRRARESDLLVVNHSLLMHDLKAGHTLLGEIDHLVVDEAHRLPAVALDSHAVGCGIWRLDEIAEQLGSRGRRKDKDRFERLDLLGVRLGALDKDGEKAAGALEEFSRALRRVFSAYRRWWDALGSRVDEVMPEPHQRQGRARVRDKDEAFAVLRNQTADLLEHLAEASNVYGQVKRATDVLEDLSAGNEDDLAQVASSGLMLRELEHDVRFLIEDDDEDWVTWVQPGPESGIRVLGATLLEAGTILKDYWTDAPFAPVMTSATLAVGEDFTHMMGELGMTRRQPSCRTFTCPSPFDYHNQVRILTPRHFPAPGAADYGTAVGEVMRNLGLNVHRKTMGLYTSFRMIRESAEVLDEAGLTDDEHFTCGPVILAQSPRVPASSLLDRFRRHRRAMLLGTATFWEGVDFPGRDLEILVVTKLPFLVPNDPWVEARCEKIASSGDNPFTKFMVRDAILRLRQGFGRLIRRVGDRGVVIILDNRLHTKNYGVTFLSALPAVPASFGDADDLVHRVEEFFSEI